ncbi:ABC transporter ATP-binding protein [Bacillus sp. SD088]|uniref:ABC transporter ATP-binding protein n=1 Tax=Bacillus sp. SD088 TaxID=2782012 RepID=UPI001A95E222|nr:ABC transporter ATP-binding protein [Bacillus sp. SD088]MBO0995916.1 ABC transporter ATP-binding protein [Bacillus sp. SD088]
MTQRLTILTDIKRILAPLVNEKLLVIVSILIGILAAGLNISRPILLGYIVGELVGGASPNKIALLIGAFACSWIMTWIASLFLQYLSAKVSQKILLQLRLGVLRHLINIPLEKGEQIEAGRLESYSSSDLPLWTSLYGSILAEVTHSLAQFAGAAIALSKLDSSLALLLVPFLIASALIPIITTRYMIGISKKAQDDISGVLERLTGIIQGLRDLISYNAQNWALKRFNGACKTSYQSQVKKTIAQSMVNIGSASTEILAYIFVLGVGSGQVMKQELNVGELVSFLGTIEMIFFPARYSNSLSSSIQNSIAAAKRVWSFLDSVETRGRSKVSSSIKLSNVSYKYPDSNRYSIKNVDCFIKPGMLIAIIGESGSGKSTLLNIISGIYDPTEGKRECCSNNLTSSTVVSQAPFLFSGTVFETLTLGYDVSLEVVREWAKLINIDDTIMELPSGYQSKVRHDGNNFSGGQIKRLAITRALIRNPGLLILDEPTAGLDVENAKMIWQVIKTLGPEVTRVVSTHRLEEAESADFIIVMKEGEIVESGTHKELTNMEGFYKRSRMALKG